MSRPKITTESKGFVQGWNECIDRLIRHYGRMDHYLHSLCGCRLKKEIPKWLDYEKYDTPPEPMEFTANEDFDEFLRQWHEFRKAGYRLPLPPSWQNIDE